MAFSRLPLQYGSRTLELVLDAFRQREDRLLRLDDICGAIIGMYSDLRQYEQDLKAAVSRELANQVMSGYVDMKGDEYYELQQFRSPMENWGTLAKPIENKANKDELSNQIRIPFVPKILIQSTNYAYCTHPGVPPGRLPSFGWFLAQQNEVLPLPSITTLQEILFAPRPERCGLSMDFY